MGDFSEDDIAAAIAASLAECGSLEEAMEIPEPVLAPPEEIMSRCATIAAEAQAAASSEVEMVCREGCGRLRARGPDGRLFPSCCKSCAYLHKKKGFCGHDINCDIRHNGGTQPPWYWKSARMWPEPFHEEIGGDYVRHMGTKLVQVEMPDHKVIKCERIEDSLLWGRYVVKREEIRRRGVLGEDIQPATSKHIDYSANTTLDHSVNEVWLFHGTSDEAARGIAKSSFKIPRGVGGCFGPGAYFADAAAKSDDYAGDGYIEGCKVLLLCRVTLGNVKKLDDVDRKAHLLVKDSEYDTIMGKTNYREFIVYDMAQIYPEYIMQYSVPTVDRTLQAVTTLPRGVGDDAQTEHVRSIFNNFDLDGDGTISRDELRTVLLKLDRELVVGDIDSLFERVDADKNDRLSVSEFLSYVLQ